MFRACMFALALSLAITPIVVAQGASFRGLGDLSGGEFRSEARAVSNDGRFVVGSSANSSTIEEAFLWSAESGMVGLGFLLGGNSSVAEGVSQGGTVVTGYSVGPGSYRPFRWTPSSGMQVLEPGAEVAFAWDISADGQFIAGGYGSSTVFGGNQEAYRWTVTGQYEFLGFAPGGAQPSSAFAISADGSVVVGSAQTEDGVQAFRWTGDEGIVTLGELPGGETISLGHNVSADGRVVVGESSSGPFREAFRWTADAGMVGLGDLPGGSFLSIATATNGDGSIVVGNSSTTGPGAAFIWDAAHGMRNLTTVLETDFGVDLAGWRLDGVSDISADGLTIIGTGTNPDGQLEAWIVSIPEPSVWALGIAAGVALGVAAAAGRKKAKVAAN